MSDGCDPPLKGAESGLVLSIANRIQTSRAGLDNRSPPIGVILAAFLRMGKTKTALSEAVHEGEPNLITINMSEFQEAHTVNTLQGASPASVRYCERAVLTETVCRKPDSVVLLDEFEQAHLRRAHDFLPGLRQIRHARRKGALHRLPECADPIDD